MWSHTWRQTLVLCNSQCSHSDATRHTEWRCSLLPSTAHAFTYCHRFVFYGTSLETFWYTYVYIFFRTLATFKVVLLKYLIQNAVAQLLEALRYKPEGWGFDSRWCHWDFGPVILDDHMTGQSSLDFLLNELPKQLEDVPLATRIAMYFQHDGATSHYTRHVMQHLNDTFPNRWIGRGSTINWPPRSPDLTPLDFCLWGLMKSEVYRKKSGYTRRTVR